MIYFFEVSVLALYIIFFSEDLRFVVDLIEAPSKGNDLSIKYYSSLKIPSEFFF